MAQSDFQRIMERRLPNVLRAIRLVGNLSTYSHDREEAIMAFEEIELSLQNARERFGLVKVAEQPQEKEPQTTPAPSEPDQPVGAYQRSEVRWALDLIKRGDKKAAQARLEVVIAAWIKEEKNDA